MRALTERECYVRLHGHRSGLVRFVETAPRPGPTYAASDARSAEPAVHLLFSYPRAGARVSGEELRLDLLRRMERRSAA
jgi:hypothetical protein